MYVDVVGRWVGRGWEGEEIGERGIGGGRRKDEEKEEIKENGRRVGEGDGV